MSYHRHLHDKLAHSRRLMADLIRTPEGYESGVPASAMVAPNHFVWNDEEVGCLPMKSSGGRVLVRLRISAERFTVGFAVLVGNPQGRTLQERAELLLCRCREQLNVKPRTPIMPYADTLISAGGVTVHRFTWHLSSPPLGLSA